MSSEQLRAMLAQERLERDNGKKMPRPLQPAILLEVEVWRAFETASQIFRESSGPRMKRDGIVIAENAIRAYGEAGGDCTIVLDAYERMERMYDLNNVPDCGACDQDKLLECDERCAK